MNRVLHSQVVADYKIGKFQETLDIMQSIANADNPKSLKLNYLY